MLYVVRCSSVTRYACSMLYSHMWGAAQPCWLSATHGSNHQACIRQGNAVYSMCNTTGIALLHRFARNVTQTKSNMVICLGAL